MTQQQTDQQSISQVIHLWLDCFWKVRTQWSHFIQWVRTFGRSAESELCPSSTTGGGCSAPEACREASRRWLIAAMNLRIILCWLCSCAKS